MAIPRMKATQAPDNLAPPATWRESAACQGTPRAEEFFPHWSAQERDGAGAVLDFCERCPVRFECLQAALQGNEAGTWGGMTETARLRLRTRLTPSNYETIGALRETLLVTFPECRDCHRHLKPKAEGRCTECYRVFHKEEQAAEAERLRGFCSQGDCETKTHAKGLCQKHYHKMHRTLHPESGAARSRKSRAMKEAA
jgi:hypothetical protein